MAHRWHDVFHLALTRSEVVGVQATVRAYLRREPTKAESSAARRAVDSFARAEPADVYQVPVDGRRMLLLARPGVEVDAVIAQRAVTRPIRPSRPRKPDVSSRRSKGESRRPPSQPDRSTPTPSTTQRPPRLPK